MNGPPLKRTLLTFYKELFRHFGPQHWWPAESPFEMIAGAILTQNTSWKNVEKGLIPLREGNYLTPRRVFELPESQLAELIRPAGFFNVKAKRLKAMARFIVEQYGGSLTRMFSTKTPLLREQLLEVKGIGPETADSILLYAGNAPVFVVDAYTRRIFSRHHLIQETDTYPDIQRIFIRHLPHHAPLFNEYHALIVQTAKVYCKTKPNCQACPLGYLLELEDVH